MEWYYYVIYFIILWLICFPSVKLLQYNKLPKDLRMILSKYGINFNLYSEDINSENYYKNKLLNARNKVYFWNELKIYAENKMKESLD